MTNSVRVLYVDDEPDLLEIGKVYLEMAGTFTVYTLTSATMALDQLTTNQFDAIVSDYQMPGMDGIAFLKQLKASGNTIPFIIFTGKGREEVVIEALNQGADFYLQKGGDPVSQYTELSNKIQYAVTQRRAEEELRRQSATLSILNDIITTANKADDLPELLRSILGESMRLLDFDAGGIYLVDQSTQTANVVYSKNLPPKFLAEIQSTPINKKPYDTLFIQNEPVFSENYAEISPEHSLKYGFCSMASIPLLSKEVTIGALNIASTRRQVITEGEKQVLISIGRELGSTIERMAAEEEVDKARKNFETLFNSIDEMVFVLDMQGRILVVNGTVLKHLSYTPEELTGMEVILLHVPERRNEALRNVQGMIAGTIDSCPVPVITKDGKHIEVETKVTRGRWNGQDVLIGVSRDVTERKQAEIALQRSEEKNRVLIENSHDIIFTINTEGKFTYISPSWTMLLGHPVSQVIEKHFRDFVHPHDLIKCLEFMQRVFETGQRQTGVEYRVKHTDGSWRWHTTNAVPLQDESGRVVGGEGSARDITDRKQVEEALKESEEKFRGIFDTINDGIHIYEVELDGKPGKFIAVNDVACQMLGYSLEEMMKHGPLDFVTGDHSRPVDEIIRELFSTGNSVFETEHRHKDGTPVPVEINARLVNLKRNWVIVAVVRDITGRKRVEEALHQLSDRLALATRAGCVGIWDLDLITNKLTWDDQMYALYGITREQFGGAYAAWQAGVHPDDRAQSDADVQMALRGEKDFDTEFRVLWPDGGIHTIRALAIVQRDAGGTPFRMIGTNWDITEIKRVEEALRKSEEKILLLLNSAAEAVYGIDMNGNCTFCNNAGLNLLGYRHQDELLGKNMHWQIHGKYPDGSHFPVEECRIFQAFNKGVGTHVDDEVLWRSDGTSFPAEYWSYPQRHDGVVIGAVVTFFDITERKILEHEMKYHEQELMQFSTSLAAMNKKLTLLSSITRHDINNQLMVLMGFLSILEKKQPDPTLNMYFQKVETAARRISAMIQFTKEYEEIGIHAPSWQDCCTLVDSAARQAPIGKVIVTNDLPAGAEVFADPLINKVFYNLMDNAARYGGKISTIRFTAEGRCGNLVIICEDDGDGVGVNEKEKIFERGFGKNTGLGLALSREALSITGITIAETGEPGRGARFEITIPKEAWRNITAGTGVI